MALGTSRLRESLLQEAERNAQELVAEEERAKRKAEKKKLKKKVGEPWEGPLPAPGGWGHCLFLGCCQRLLSSGIAWCGAAGTVFLCLTPAHGSTLFPFPEAKRPKETGEAGARAEEQREHCPGECPVRPPRAVLGVPRGGAQPAPPFPSHFTPSLSLQSPPSGPAGAGPPPNEDEDEECCPEPPPCPGDSTVLSGEPGPEDTEVTEVRDSLSRGAIWGWGSQGSACPPLCASPGGAGPELHFCLQSTGEGGGPAATPGH